jgi:large subunit ribosomal protein L35
MLLKTCGFRTKASLHSIAAPLGRRRGRSVPSAVRRAGGRDTVIRKRETRLRAVTRTKESKMPKMKTKSGAKKRFKMTGSGKVKAGAAGKRHGMIKRTTKFIQKARGTMVLNDSDAKIVKKYMPYAR